jgi:hypothetical protein
MAQPYRVLEPGIVRIAGLPVGVLAGLRFARTTALVDDVLARDAWLATEGAALGDLLYAAIGALTVPALRPRLVGLRRSVHSGRLPRRQEWDDETARALPDAVAERVRAWVAALDARNACAATLPGVLADEVATRTGVLRRVVESTRFRHGLAHSSPALSDELARWLDGGAPDRQVLHRLARYISRAATKTSPYSTFTSSGTGRWVDRAGHALGFRADARDHGVFDLHGATLPQLERALAARPDLRGALWVRRNPSATETEGRLTFLGPGPAEPVVAVRVTAEVRRCLDALGAGWSTVDSLSERLGDGDTVPGQRIAAFVDRLAEIGLLELRVPVPDQADDPLGALADWLDRAGQDRYAPLATACRALGKEVTTPTEPDEYAGHRERLRAIQRRVAEVGTLAGLDWAGFATADTGAVHENAVFGTCLAELSTPAWRPALDDLAALRPWFGLQDPGLPQRLALGTYVRERFGTGGTVPFLELHRLLREDPPRTDDDPRVRALWAERRHTAQAVLARPPGPDGTINVDPQGLHGGHPGPEDVTCFVQPWLRDGELRLVLNAVFAGPGRGRSRWLRLAGAPTTTGGETGAAEVSGTFGMPFNVRYPTVAREIDYPFTMSDREAGQRVPLADLVVVHDPATDTVRLRAGGREVRPVHTGLQAELLLPPALRLLVQGFGPAPTLVHTAQPAFTPVPPGTVLGRVTALPRVDAGRVTVQRAAWLAPYELVPLRTKGETDAAYLLRLRGWLREHGVPDRCFVQALTVRGTRPTAMTKARKPLYVDFGNWFLCAVFERLLRGPADLVVFREALPTPEHAFERAPGDTRVTEVLVELAGVGDG